MDVYPHPAMRAPCHRRVLRFLGLVIFSVGSCLLLPALPLLQAAEIPTIPPAQLVQQGVDAYRNGQYAEAISHWEQALDQYPENQVSRERAIVLENLARAHQQIGQPTPSLAYWQTVAGIYTSLENWDQLGRALTEEAQVYSRLGQPFQAIGLLCTGNMEGIASDLIASVTNPDNLADAQPSNTCHPNSAIAITHRFADLEAQIAALGSLGEAYRSIQDYAAAVAFLQQGLGTSQGLNSPYYQALLHNSLGHTYREKAEFNYQQATASLRSASGDEASFHENARSASTMALAAFTTSQAIAQQANYPALELKALLGLIAVSSHTGDRDQVATLREQAIPLLAKLPPNREKVYLTLQLAKQKPAIANSEGIALQALSYEASRSECLDIADDARVETLLEQANTLAEGLGNNRLKAFTQGEIGHFHECAGQYTNALEWTQKAQLAASGDQVLALDTLYLWQWQMGRIYKDLKQFDRAIEFYSQAAENLNRVRDEILASNQNLQFDFRDAVAPVYRELAEIQLSLANPSADIPPITGEASLKAIASNASVASVLNNEGYIKGALGNIDNLQLAELQNYFGNDCLVPIAERRLDETLAQLDRSEEPTPEEQTAKASTALISTVFFTDKTAVILTLPNRAPLLHWINLPAATFRETIIRFRNSLEDTSNELEGYDTQLAQDLYGEFIAPFQTALENNRIETLVFVSDGILRNIPMAALYDGERHQYLVEQYAVAIAPSLQQYELGPDTTDRRALVLGLSQEPIVNGQELGALPAVRREVQDVVSLLPGSELLLNTDLTQANLRKTLQNSSYPIVHIATHGQFGTDPQDTFLVMGDKIVESAKSPAQMENRLLRLGELDTLLREGTSREGLLELIVLSACQTASGDERSTLGLAGVTIRAGAKSAIASLWAVSDEATADLITNFYQAWQSGLPKAEALRTAQQHILRNSPYPQHPAYWSAFVLVGDWQ